MSVVHYFSSISPIPCHNRKSELSGGSVKSQMKCSTTCLLQPEFTHMPYGFQIPAGTASGVCLTKTCHSIKDLLATKAVKTGNAEISSFVEEDIVDFDCIDEDDEGAIWEGAIVYCRNPSISHVECCTTLERLGLAKLSSEVSRSKASAMGLRVTKAVKEYLDGTPVLVSVDITRKKHKLRLDGIIRTVIALSCNRCGEPAAESVFSNFSLLLTEDLVEEPEIINMGTIYGDEKSESSAGALEEEEDEDDALIDLEDRLYFPPEEKKIDISKHVRDLIHLEITITAVCDRKCKGLCLQCGMNLNTSVCSCNKQEVNNIGLGPLGELRKQMQKV